MEKFKENQDFEIFSGKKKKFREITKEEARQKTAKKYGLPESATWDEIAEAIINDEPVNKEK